MKKLAKFVLMVVLGIFIFGCAAAQIGIGVAQIAVIAVSGAAKLAGGQDEEINYGKEIERLQINSKYQVRVSDGFIGKKSCIYLVAYDDKGISFEKSLRYDKNNPQQMAEIDTYNRMKELEKKRYAKETFLKYAEIDLGPVETATASAPAPAAELQKPSSPAPANK